MTVNKVCSFLILILLLLSSGSVYANLLSAGIFYSAILFISLFLIFLNPNLNFKNFKALALSLAVSIGVLIVSWATTGFELTDMLYPKLFFRFTCVNVGFFALVISNKGKFDLSQLLFPLLLVALHALVNFLLGLALGDARVTVPSDKLTIQSLGYLFFYISLLDIGSLTVLRNNGLFWEPGVLAVMMNLYLFLLLYHTPNKITFPKVLAVLMVISTFSTTGLVVMSLIFIFHFSSQKITKNQVFIFAMLALIMTPILINNIQEKLYGDNKLSFALRNYDSLIALDIIRNNPITGIGPSLQAYFDEQSTYDLFVSNTDFKDNRGNTNSILSTFVSFGIPVGSVFLFLLFYQRFIVYSKRFFFICLLLLSSEPLIFTGVFMIIMASTFYPADNLKYEPLLNED